MSLYPTAEALMEEAKARTGLSDFGPPTFREGLDRLIEEANRRGGLDNITVILVQIDEVSPPTGEVPVPR